MSYAIIAGDYNCSITAGGFFSLSGREKEPGDRIVLMSHDDNTVVAYSGPAYINNDWARPVTKNMIDEILKSSESSPDIEGAKDFLSVFSDGENAHIVIGQNFMQKKSDDLDDSMGDLNAELIAISRHHYTKKQAKYDFPVCFAISDESSELKEFCDHSTMYHNGEHMSQYIDSVQCGLHKYVGNDYGNRLTDIVRFVHGHPASVLRIKGQSTENDLLIGGDSQ